MVTAGNSCWWKEIGHQWPSLSRHSAHSAEIGVQTCQYNGTHNTYHHYNGVQSSIWIVTSCSVFRCSVFSEIFFFKLSIWLKYKSLSGVAQMSCFMVVYSTGRGWSLELVSRAGGIFWLRLCLILKTFRHCHVSRASHCTRVTRAGSMTTYFYNGNLQHDSWLLINL